jgi:hypothetical protein
MYISSGGGNVFSGWAMMSALERTKAHITVHIDGIAASMATGIAMIGGIINKPLSDIFTTSPIIAIPVAMDAAMPSMCTVICAFVRSSADIIAQPENTAKFNVSGFMRGDSESRANYYDKMLKNGVYSINEVRKMEEMNKIDHESANGHYKQVNEANITKADIKFGEVCLSFAFAKQVSVN